MHSPAAGTLALAAELFPMLRSSHRTQADAVDCAARSGTAAASGQSGQPPHSKTCDPPFPPRSASSCCHRRAISTGLTRMREMKLQDLKAKIPGRTARLCRRTRGRERLDHAQAGADVRDPQAAGRQAKSTSSAKASSRCCRTASASCARRKPTISPGPDDIYVSPVADPPLRPAHRRHRRGPDPQPEGGRALFRAAQGQYDQLRGPGEGPPQDQFRQPDAALSGRAAEHGARRSDHEGHVGARHRHRRADRQGPARADRGAAAHRQDRAAAEHRARRSPPTTPNAT